MSIKQNERMYYLDDVNKMIDSIDGHIEDIWGIKSIINKDVMKYLFERIAIAESDSSGIDKLSYKDIFNIIDMEWKSIDTYMYYINLYRYYSRQFSIEQLYNLSDTLEDFYTSTHFMDYFSNDGIPNISKELLDRLNRSISCYRDIHITFDDELKTALEDDSNIYGLQHKRMYDAMMRNKDVLEHTNLSEDDKYDLVYRAYLKLD